MMSTTTVDALGAFIIPSRTLEGSREEMVQDVDQAILGLLALRHLIDAGAPLPEALALGGTRRPARRRRRWPPWQLKALLTHQDPLTAGISYAFRSGHH